MADDRSNQESHSTANPYSTWLLSKTDVTDSVFVRSVASCRTLD
jgi:hypothetical protein